MSIEVASLHRYPVKSCAVEDLETAVIGPNGIEHDREWMLVDADGKFMSQRKHPQLALVQPRLTEDTLELSAPKAGELRLPLIETAGKMLVSATVHRDTVIGSLQGRQAAEWASEVAGEPANLIRVDDAHPRSIKERFQRDEATNQTGYADSFPFLLTTEASLGKLNEQLANPVPMNRFRPNIVVRGEGAAYEEDFWREVRISKMRAFVVRACARCEIPDTDQATAERENIVRLALGQTRYGADLTTEGTNGFFFGQNLTHVYEAGLTVAVGDAVEVTARAGEPNIRLRD